MSELRVYLSLTQIGMHVLLLSKLFRTRLFRQYQYFGWYVAFELLRLSVVSFVRLQSKAYAHFYFATQPILWVLFVLVLLELFQLVLRNHQGIEKLGRKALTWSLAGSAVVSGLTLLVELQQNASESVLLYNFMLLERLVMTSLLVLILCLIAFLSVFPVPLSRNLRTHASVFAVYFAVRTSLFWVRTIFGLQLATTLNIVGQILALGCLIAWIVLLTPAGEAVPPPSGPKSGSEARLLAQLDALNETLLGSARK